MKQFITNGNQFGEFPIHDAFVNFLGIEQGALGETSFAIQLEMNDEPCSGDIDNNANISGIIKLVFVGCQYIQFEYFGDYASRDSVNSFNLVTNDRYHLEMHSGSHIEIICEKVYWERMGG